VDVDEENGDEGSGDEDGGREMHFLHMMW
jgi:hypothetical protein